MGRVAPLADAFRRRLRNPAGPLSALSASGLAGRTFLPDLFGGAGRQSIEIAPGADLTAPDTEWTWIDITEDLLWDPGVSITIGRQDEATQAQPATCNFTLRNGSGNYTQFSPASRFFPNLKTDMPVRLRLSVGDRWYTRFQGFLDGIVPEWDNRNNYAVANLSASGLLRRIAQGKTALTSPLTRTVMRNVNEGTLLAYWPCEETGEPEFFGSMTVTGGRLIAAGASAGAFSTIPGTKPIMTLSGASSGLSGGLDGSAASGTVSFRTLVSVPDAGLDNGINMFDIFVSGSNVDRWTVQYSTASGGSIRLLAVDSNGATIDSTGVLAFGINGKQFEFDLDLEQNGSNVDTHMLTWEVNDDGTIAASGTFWDEQFTGVTVGDPYRFVAGAFGGLDGCAIGQIAVGTDTLLQYGADREVLSGWSGETTDERVYRLCAEHGIAATLSGSSDTTMGPQPNATLIDALRECEVAEGGILYDGLDAGLGFIARSYIQNWWALLTLDASAGQVVKPFRPVADDRLSVNDVTVSRANGSFGHYQSPDFLTDPSTPLRDESIEVNWDTDEGLEDRAAFEVNRRNIKAYRFPNLNVNLRKNYSKVPEWLTVELSGRIDVTNFSSIVPGVANGDIRLLVEGWHEHWNSLQWDVEVNASPYDPWLVATIEASYPEMVWRIDSGGSTLAANAVAGATSLTVNVTDGYLWSTSAGDYPRGISVGGAYVRVTAVAGASSPQTFTVDPLPYPLTAGWEATLWNPPKIAL